MILLVFPNQLFANHLGLKLGPSRVILLAHSLFFGDKPYFSGSSYVRKMSHYKQEPWCEICDGLYWRWIWNHADDLAKNPRWAMMCSMAKKMDSKKRKKHLECAERFLKGPR